MSLLKHLERRHLRKKEVASPPKAAKKSVEANRFCKGVIGLGTEDETDQETPELLHALPRCIKLACWHTEATEDGASNAGSAESNVARTLTDMLISMREHAC